MAVRACQNYPFPKLTFILAVAGVILIFSGLNRFKGEKDNCALLLMSLDVIAKLNEEGWPVSPGDLGENLSIDGVLYSFFEKNQKYRAGSVLFELTEQANPCKKLAQLNYVGEDKLADFIKTMMGRRGWYAKVVEPGIIKKGDNLILL